MENNSYYGGRDINGRLLTPDFIIEPETILLNIEAEPDRKQVTA